MAAAMAVGGDGRGDVHQVHYAPAEDVAQHIGVLWEYDLYHVHPRGSDSFPGKRPARLCCSLRLSPLCHDAIPSLLRGCRCSGKTDIIRRLRP